MARKAFYSFHYNPDNWRAAKIRSIGAIEGNAPASDNDWEKITQGGDPAIERWIDNQLSGKSVAIVLVGSSTAGRKWISHEISRAWNQNKGVLGIHIHKITDRIGNQTLKGNNPFDYVTLTAVNKKLSSVVKVYDPPYSLSADVYDYIKNNIADWIEAAITIRAAN